MVCIALMAAFVNLDFHCSILHGGVPGGVQRLEWKMNLSCSWSPAIETVTVVDGPYISRDMSIFIMSVSFLMALAQFAIGVLCCCGVSITFRILLICSGINWSLPPDIDAQSFGI